MKIKIYHAYYGCDTGCCGHIISLDDDPFWADRIGSFEWGHIDSKAEAVEFLKENKEAILKAIPEECHDSLDWESLDGLDSIVDWENSRILDSDSGYC